MTDPASAASTISEVFEPYELPSELVSQLTQHLSNSPMLPSFLMNFHHTLPKPSESRAVICALTIALGYFVGGFVPLLPYFFVGPHDAFVALRWSIITMVIALFIFGYGKTCFVSGWRGRRNIRKGVVGGLQMVLVGGLAAGSAMGLVKGFQMLAQSGDPDHDHQWSKPQTCTKIFSFFYLFFLFTALAISAFSWDTEWRLGLGRSAGSFSLLLSRQF